jgi:hypothetical protein
MRGNPGIRLSGGSLALTGFGVLVKRVLDLRLSTKLWISTLASMVSILLCVALGWSALDAFEALLPADQAAGFSIHPSGDATKL